MKSLKAKMTKNAIKKCTRKICNIKAQKQERKRMQYEASCNVNSNLIQKACVIKESECNENKAYAIL